MSNSYPDEHGFDLAALFSDYPSYPAPDPLPFSFPSLINTDSDITYSAPTLVDSGPKNSVDYNSLHGFFYDNDPVSSLDSYTLPAPVAGDANIFLPQPKSGANLADILQLWEDFDTLSQSQAQTQPQPQHPLLSTVVVDPKVQQSVVGSSHTSQLMSGYVPSLSSTIPSPLDQNPHYFPTEAATRAATTDWSNAIPPTRLAWPSSEPSYSPQSTPSPLPLDPYHRYLEASARAQELTAGPPASTTFQPVSPPLPQRQTNPRRRYQRPPTDDATSLATEYICHWVNPNSPDGICGHKQTGRLSMWKGHLIHAHGWGREVRAGKTRLLCGWEGCETALVQQSCKRDHLMTHLKHQEGGPHRRR